MTTLLLDTHALQWWSAEPDRISPAATASIEEADVLAVAAITWFELAWLAHNERITVAVPIPSWLDSLARGVSTFRLSPAIAHTAATLPSTFPGDPADRIIYATAIEHGVQVVTKDRRLRDHEHPAPVAIW